MGDDLSLAGRESVRTAMQWTSGQNAGFSRAHADRLECPLIRAGPYGYERINVADQDRDPDSLLNWFEHAIRVRKRCPEFGRGAWQLLKTREPEVFAHGATSGDRVVVAVHNLAGRPCRPVLDLQPFRKKLLVDLLGDRTYQRLDSCTHQVELEPYGFRWFRLDDERELTL